VKVENVELTDDETNLVIEEAKIKKQIILEHEAKQEWRRQMEAEALRKWDAKEQWVRAKSLATSLQPTYQVDDEIKEVFRLLCLYFTNDERFEENGEFKLKKGIMLAGNVGTGKTLLMRVFSRNKRQCFEIIPCRKPTDDYSEDGMEMLPRYSNPIRSLLGTYEYFLQRELGVCFDDLGTETIPARYYGKDVNVMEQIILNRYDRKVPHNLTHFTTNLTWKQVEIAYGTRVSSRLTEMTNLIELTGNDRRK
jgi:hypothetical protein